MPFNNLALVGIEPFFKENVTFLSKKWGFLGQFWSHPIFFAPSALDFTSRCIIFTTSFSKSAKSNAYFSFSSKNWQGLVKFSKIFGNKNAIKLNFSVGTGLFSPKLYLALFGIQFFRIWHSIHF